MKEREARRRLHDAEQEARRAIQNLVESGLQMSFKQSVQTLSSYDNHPADSASETFERELDEGLRTERDRRLQAIEAAWRRLDRETFGQCERCGAAIGDARLRAVPWTALCRHCQGRQDNDAGGQARTTRTAGEGIIPMPYGQRPQAGRSPVGFDGQDTWQALARYGTANGPQDGPAAPDPESPDREHGRDRGRGDGADDLVDPWADTPGQAFSDLARRPGRPPYDGAEGEAPGRAGSHRRA